MLSLKVLKRKCGETEPVVFVEEKLTSRDGKIEGKPDRVDTTPSSYRVVDFKTGWDGGGEIPDRFRHQLLIYAYLWQQSSGTWPIEAALQAVDGRIKRMLIDSTEAEDVVGQVHAAMDSVNVAVQANDDAETLASPTDTSCRFCSWRPRCGPFLRDRSTTDRSETTALIGDVVDGEETHGRAAVSMKVPGPRSQVDSDRARILDVPLDLAIQVGDRLSVVNVRPTGHGAQYRWQAWTTWWRFDLTPAT